MRRSTPGTGFTPPSEVVVVILQNPALFCEHAAHPLEPLWPRFSLSIHNDFPCSLLGSGASENRQHQIKPESSDPQPVVGLVAFGLEPDRHGCSRPARHHIGRKDRPGSAHPPTDRRFAGRHTPHGDRPMPAQINPRDQGGDALADYEALRLWMVTELPSGSETTAMWHTGVSIGPKDTE